MKKWISFLLSVSIVLGMCGGIVPNVQATQADLQTDDGLWQVEICEEGVVLNAYLGTAVDVYAPGNVTVDGAELTVVKLGDGIFADNDAINSVTLGDSIVAIGDRAFFDADNLVCIVTHEALQTIGAEAFSGCDSFNSIILYDWVTAIGENAFADCPKVTIWCNEDTVGHTYAVDNGIAYEILNPAATPETVTLDGITYYVMNGEAYAIGADKTLTEIEVVSTVNGCPVTTLKETFKECKKLTEVTLPETLTEIGSYAFYWCTNLTSVNIPASVTKIGDYAFYWCTSLTSVNIPASVTEIGNNAFNNCNKAQINGLPPRLKSIGAYAFCYCRFTSLTIPGSVRSIGSGAFSSCRFSSVTLENGINTIAGRMFEGCTSLKSIRIPKSVDEIDTYAFKDCKFLESVELSEGLWSVSSSAFYGCSSLKTVLIPESVSDLVSSSFPSTTILLVYKDSYAHTFAAENNLLYYIYDGETLPTVTEIGGVTYFVVNGEAMAIAADKTLTEIEVVSEVNGCPVTSLKETFRNHTNLIKVTLPETLTEIGDYSFYQCSNLTSVNIPTNVSKIGEYAFYCCTSLQKIDLPAVLTHIGRGAFQACVSITSITIPGSVTNIENYVFQTCSNLAEVTLENGITCIYTAMFEDCSALKRIRIPESVTQINSSAFRDCTSLESIEFPQNLKHISSYAFLGCSNLKMVVIPKSVTYLDRTVFNDKTILAVYEDSYAHTFAAKNNLLYYIYDGETLPTVTEIGGVTYFVANGEAMAIGADKTLSEIEVVGEVNGCPVTSLKGTFRDHTNLTKVTLPETLTEIGDYAFYQCSNLTSVNIPASVSKIGERAFYGCTSFQKIDLPSSLESIGSYAFCNCTGIKVLDLPEGLKNIGEGAFMSCSSLKRVTIPGSVTSVGNFVFRDCSNLTEVTLKNGFSIIGNYMFYCCSSLKSITIPESVKGIYSEAFYSCKSIKNIALPEGLERIDGNAFRDCSGLKTVIIPESVIFLRTNSFPETTILLVYEDSYAHTYAQENDSLYFVLHRAENPEIYFGAAVSGTATYFDGSTVSGATVEILYDDGTLKESVTTDGSGNYAFTYAEVGSYTIRATDAKGNTASTKIAVKRMNAFDVFVSGDTNLTLKKAYSVSGTVNEGVAQVTITDLEGNVIASTEAGQDGAFTIPNIPNGTYVITAESATGSAAQEITVFNGNLSGLYLEIQSQAATIWGYTAVVQRDGSQTNRNWVQVTVYNGNGIAVAQCRSNTEGKYTVGKLPAGTYSIVAETTEIRPDKHKGFDRSHALTGYGYVVVTAVEEYQVDIVLYEENDHLAKISGKVTAHGQTQKSTVILRDVFQNEIASYTTKRNGKYTFSNVRDGLYFITAITESEGMGYAVVVVRGGEVYGDTDITVEKYARILAREQKFNEEVPELTKPAEAEQYRSRIAEEKAFYDSLSQKEKQQLSALYVARLNQYVEWLAEVEYTASEGVSVEQGGLVVSGDELEQDCQITYIIDVQKTDGYAISDSGIHDRDDYLHYSMEDAAKEHAIQQHYEITMYKSVDGKRQPITDVQKDTDATGKFRITLEIPEEYRGYKHFSILHEHHGEIVQLTDLDNDPNTITVEVDAFSDFVLTATDIPLILETLFSAGDIDGNEAVDYEDAVYLLLHALFGGDVYPLDGADADVDGNGVVDHDDAVYLLLHTLFGDAFYPLEE